MYENLTEALVKTLSIHSNDYDEQLNQQKLFFFSIIVSWLKFFVFICYLVFSILKTFYLIWLKNGLNTYIKFSI